MEDKFDEISFLVLEHQLDIFAVSETFNQSINIDLLCIPGFKEGPGAFYISSSVCVKRRFDLECDAFELHALGIDVRRFL